MPRPSKREWQHKAEARKRLLGRGWGSFCKRVGYAHESTNEIIPHRGDAAKIEFLLQFYEEHSPLSQRPDAK